MLSPMSEDQTAKQPSVSLTSTTFEKHYRVSELARIWGLGRESTRKLVMFEPGVIKIRLGRKQSNTTYSIPASVADRVHRRLTNG